MTFTYPFDRVRHGQSDRFRCIRWRSRSPKTVYSGCCRWNRLCMNLDGCYLIVLMLITTRVADWYLDWSEHHKQKGKNARGSKTSTVRTLRSMCCKALEPSPFLILTLTQWDRIQWRWSSSYSSQEAYCKCRQDHLWPRRKADLSPSGKGLADSVPRPPIRNQKPCYGMG